MMLEFANHVEHVWRPTSYLYKKGRSKVYCLTIVSEETQEEQQQQVLGGSEAPGRSLGTERPGKRRLQKSVKQAVLGSSFFINHDLVFHLGRWELASTESACPSTSLESRRKK